MQRARGEADTHFLAFSFSASFASRFAFKSAIKARTSKTPSAAGVRPHVSRRREGSVIISTHK